MENIESSSLLVIDKLTGWYQSFLIMLPNLLVAVVVLGIFWFFGRVFSLWSRRLLAKSPLNESLVGMTHGFIRFGVLMIGVIIALGVLNLDKTVFSILAGVGVLGIVLGFAFQDLGANLISGVFMAVRSPFRIGDVIEVKDKLGTVEDMRLRDTTIRNFSGQRIIIPNKDLMNGEITNYSQYGSRRMSFSVGVSYGDNLRGAKKLIENVLESFDFVLKDPKPVVSFQEFADSSINMNVYFWIQYPGADIFETQNEAFIGVKEALDREGYTIPFPIRSLELPKSEIFKVMKSFGFEEKTRPANGSPPNLS